MRRKSCEIAGAVGVLCLVPFASALAQPVPAQERTAAAVDRNANPIRVQVGVNFFVPGPADESADSMALREHARRSIYEMAAHECELLREKLADDCRLESVNVNLNRQFGQQFAGQQFPVQQVEGFQVGGTFGYRITRK
jgi:hypothetical protein